MTDNKHRTRVSDGFEALFLIGIAAVLLTGFYLVTTEFIIPFVIRFNSEFQTGLVIVLGMIVASYILGYMKNDLISDIKKWRGDDDDE